MFHIQWAKEKLQQERSGVWQTSFKSGMIYGFSVLPEDRPEPC